MLQIYERAVTLRQQVGALDLIAGMHNTIQRTQTAVETPLLEPRMTAVQAALSKGLLVRSIAYTHRSGFDAGTT